MFPASFASHGKHDNAAIYSVVLVSYGIIRIGGTKRGKEVGGKVIGKSHYKRE